LCERSRTGIAGSVLMFQAPDTYPMTGQCIKPLLKILYSAASDRAAPL